MVCRYQVIQSIEKSLQWIDSKKFLVNPLKHNYSNRESHKMFSELQFVMSSLCEIKDLLSNKSIRHIEEIVNFSKAIILDPRYYELVQKDTSCFRMYGVAVMSFLKCYNGIEVSFLKEIIQKSYENLFKFYSKIILWQRYASWLRACQPCIRSQWSAS